LPTGSEPNAGSVLIVIMKRVVVLGALCLLGSLAVLGESRPPRRFANPLLDDVVDMTRAEIPDATILAFLRVRRTRLENDVTAQDLIQLRREGVADEIIQYVASQSGVEFPPATRLREAAGPDAAAPGSGLAEPVPDAPDAAEESRPEEPDPGDIGLIMGVYDPIPVGGYPCWPPSLAPYDCGGPAIFIEGGSGSRGRHLRGGGHDPRGEGPTRDRRVESNKPRADDQGRTRPEDRNRDRSGRGSVAIDGERGGNHGASSDGRSERSGGRSAGGGHGRR
jgi:hypothetical protein